MRNVTVAATQMACTWDLDSNVARAEHLVRQASAKGANIILIQELFEAPYFCKDQDPKHFKLAQPFKDNPLLARMSQLAKELKVVLPVSFFERANRAYFNSLAVIDADGTIMDLYRKSHIPDGHGYQEKYYFSPGDTGFKVWNTQFGVIGVGICWDQWFPEAARAMALMGAELLFYPTAIGSEPQDASIDSSGHWQRTMQGHSAANCIPVIASNRIGKEDGDTCAITFYGSSFITGGDGGMIATANRTDETILTTTFDLDKLNEIRTAWGLFRDRRPHLYSALNTLDGLTKE
ncbi:N-carbamoylputrescine amidase [Beggiatoa leptomitoformis]|uniref:N-carbamoylputrescine amidase n=2 Tax=Beggiatoa leptomitoformis TaxID=288004 RepID=A0A2N9YIZ2_9GAMM|nr:N-carbamoylputrescine amidase [Beggiatoa leptomitoformis]ALG69322.2 N-carbamoylputrescine amidase [Beggiatoa leptomitoformis]AUI70492.2 N-carbamoylputrescine amidase [Beggiatoa leptomitoformis]